jgi:hypothetical protein
MASTLSHSHQSHRLRQSATPTPPAPGEAGFSMIATVLALLATAVLTAILLGTTLGANGSTGSPSSGSGISNAPGVAEATSLQAQQTLSTGLTTVMSMVASAGGYGSLQPSTLSASDPSITFLSGPSTNATTISLAVVGGVGNGGGGSVTLAVRSTGGTCWLAWKSSGSDTWYGAQTGQSSCTAPALASVPTAGPVSASSIGWQEGSYPTR